MLLPPPACCQCAWLTSILIGIRLFYLAFRAATDKNNHIKEAWRIDFMLTFCLQFDNDRQFDVLGELLTDVAQWVCVVALHGALQYLKQFLGIDSNQCLHRVVISICNRTQQN